jgi:hypothetical protein
MPWVKLPLPSGIVHDKGVVHRNTDDLVDTLCPQLRRQLVVARHVGGRAGGCKRPGKGKHDNGFTLEQLLGCDFLPFVATPHLESGIGDTLAFSVL